MDAIVFFVASIIVSGILLSLVTANTDRTDAPPAIQGFDAHAALAAFLGASLGTEVELVIESEGITLSEREEVAECVLLEAHCIAEGDAMAAFSALNNALQGILEAISGAYMRPSLRVLDVTNASPVVLFCVPAEWDDVREAQATSSTLTDAEGRNYLVQLRSVPASCAEL